MAKAGYGDVLLMMRGRGRTVGIPKDKLLNVHDTDKPAPLVSRDHVAEIVERITKDGSVLVALDEEQARISLLALLEQDIGAVAVALLWFFKDPAHDRRARELICSNDLGQSLSVERMCPRSSVQSKPDL